MKLLGKIFGASIASGFLLVLVMGAISASAFVLEDKSIRPPEWSTMFLTWFVFTAFIALTAEVTTEEK